MMKLLTAALRTQTVSCKTETGMNIKLAPKRAPSQGNDTLDLCIRFPITKDGGCTQEKTSSRDEEGRVLR